MCPPCPISVAMAMCSDACPLDRASAPEPSSSAATRRAVKAWGLEIQCNEPASYELKAVTDSTFPLAEVAAALAHEIRQPLTAIEMNVSAAMLVVSAILSAFQRRLEQKSYKS